MAKYFKKLKSFEDLKKQYRSLLKEYHPDNGGDLSKMQEINMEYEALFKIWKERHEAATGEKVSETADSTRSQFYTAFGWEGKNHDWNRSLKEVAVIVRTYVKEKYPTYKFSVRTSYASMCQELHVELKESPVEIYKSFEELTGEDKNNLISKMRHNGLFELNSWYDEELKIEFERIWNAHGNFYKCLNEVTQNVIKDVDSFVRSYNYEDCDGMIDYFNVDFYYFGCAQNNGWNIKIVPKTARIQTKTAEAAKKKQANKPQTSEPGVIEQKNGYTFKVTEGLDTRDDSKLWVVRIEETLTRDEYTRMNKEMQKIGGYYSRYKHGFIFRFDPSEKILETSN